MEDSKHKISILNEIKRKGIHLSSSVIPVFYYYNTKELTLIILGAMLAGSVTIDILRYYVKDFTKFYNKIFYTILRPHEKAEGKLAFTGATYLVFAALVCILIFPKEIAITSILILTISDSFAALVGKYAGRIRFKDKSLEGSLAFFISGLIIIFLTPKVSGDADEYIAVIGALIITTFIEVIPVKIDDNILIPLSFGALYFLLLNLF